MCLEGVCVWMVSGRCPEGVLKLCFEVSEKCLEGILKAFGRGLNGILKVSESCQESVLKVSGGRQVGTGQVLPGQVWTGRFRTG